jgi:hypothetical protein
MIGKINKREYIELNRVWKIEISQDAQGWMVKYIYNIKEDGYWKSTHATEKEAEDQIAALYGGKMRGHDRGN